MHFTKRFVFSIQFQKLAYCYCLSSQLFAYQWTLDKSAQRCRIFRAFLAPADHRCSWIFHYTCSIFFDGSKEALEADHVER